MAKECSHFLEQVELGCYLAQARQNTHQMYEERLDGEFSTPHFQALKAKACTVRSGASGVMSVWNAAWVQCQEARQRLEDMQKKNKCVDKSQNQQATAVNTQGEAAGMENKEEKSKVEKAACSMTQLQTSHKEVDDVSESASESTTVACFNHHLKPDMKRSEKGESKALQLPEAPVKNGKMTLTFPQNGNCHPETKWRPREHHSEADLRSADSVEGGDDFPSHKPVGRSLSEGSHVSSRVTFASGFSPLNERHKHCQSKTQPLEQNLQPVQNQPTSHDESLHSGHLSCKSKRDTNEEEGGSAKECTVSTQNPIDLRTQEILFNPTENNGTNVL